jgi:SAM-dependent methyltransferase
MALPKNLRSIHPFPARMAPELVWDELPDHSARLRVLDPMAGSGTTLVTAKLRGHEAIGYDRDPLAVLIARSWFGNVEPKETQAKATEVLSRARARAGEMALSDAYPRASDEETKAFVRYWFDRTNRIQLTALSDSISGLRDPALRDLMWCALSRLIITKKTGVSLAMDVSHSRPHRRYDKAPINAFDHFERSVNQVINAAPFSNAKTRGPRTSVSLADARKLPLGDESVDVVITSPPYLNAIDYLRGHKFSLVWMGHSIADLRALRSTNVGTETMGREQIGDAATERVVREMCPVEGLASRHVGMLRQYVRDMRTVLSETRRVLRTSGKAVFVIGNCNLRDTFVENSKCIESLARELGMIVSNTRSRPLPENRRYLPPPGSSGAGAALKKRMREEVIITLLKLRSPL